MDSKERERETERESHAPPYMHSRPMHVHACYLSGRVDNHVDLCRTYRDRREIRGFFLTPYVSYTYVQYFHINYVCVASID